MSQDGNVPDKPGLISMIAGHALRGVGGLLLKLAGDGNMILLQRPKHRRRVTFDVVEETPSERHWVALRDKVAALVLARDWMQIARLLEDADVSQSSCPAGYRDRMIAMEAFLDSLMEGRPGPWECEGLPEPRIPAEVVAELMALHEIQPQRYGLAAMAAQAMMAQCWDLRGYDYADVVPDSAWDWISRNVEKTMSLLEVELGDHAQSALLLQARLTVLPFCSDSDDLIIDWFEAALMADLGDTTCMNKIGNFLLPRWFGDYDRLEYVARRAATLSRDVMGDGAYAAIYNSALEMEPVPLYFMDAEKYASGTNDLVRLRGHCPAYVARKLEFSWLMSFWGYLGGMDDDARAQWDEKRARLYQLCGELLGRGLHAIHPSSWREGENGALNLISMMFQDALVRGDTIIVDGNGVRAIPVDTELSDRV